MFYFSTIHLINLKGLNARSTYCTKQAPRKPLILNWVLFYVFLRLTDNSTQNYVKIPVLESILVNIVGYVLSKGGLQ